MSSSKVTTVLRPASQLPNAATAQPAVQHIIHQPIQASSSHEVLSFNCFNVSFLSLSVRNHLADSVAHCINNLGNLAASFPNIIEIVLEKPL